MVRVYDDTSRKNLRQELHRLAGTPLGPDLALTPEEVGLQGDVETDVDRFRRLARQGALEAALDLYGGPLLAGLDLRGAAGFDEWLLARREALAAERLTLLERLQGACEAAGDPRGALAACLTLMTTPPPGAAQAGRPGIAQGAGHATPQEAHSTRRTDTTQKPITQATSSSPDHGGTR